MGYKSEINLSIRTTYDEKNGFMKSTTGYD